jgi:hypothetical protein
MWTIASTPLKICKARAAAPTAATFKAAAEAMTAKGDDRTEGLAQQSLNTSVVQPGQGGPDGQGHGDRSLTGNDQREGLEKTEPKSPKNEDKPQGS